MKAFLSLIELLLFSLVVLFTVKQETVCHIRVTESRQFRDNFVTH